MEQTVGFEHTQLKGLTIKNMIITITCTASIVITIMSAYSGLKSQNDINDLRIRVTEARVTVLEQNLRELQLKILSDPKK